MTDIPIIMSGPMVLACLREVEKPGTGKTQTRRLLYTKRKWKSGITPASVSFLRDHPPPPTFAVDECWSLSGWHKAKPGDRLWVRENWRADDFDPENPARTIYQADAPSDVLRETKGIIRWRPSIHLPRERSRLTLIVAATRIERLQDITEADAMAEGAELRIAGSGMTGSIHYTIATYRTGFVHLWGQLHGTESWLTNPEVVPIRFVPHLCNIDAMPQADEIPNDEPYTNILMAG